MYKLRCQHQFLWWFCGMADELDRCHLIFQDKNNSYHSNSHSQDRGLWISFSTFYYHTLALGIRGPIQEYSIKSRNILTKISGDKDKNLMLKWFKLKLWFLKETKNTNFYLIEWVKWTQLKFYVLRGAKSEIRPFSVYMNAVKEQKEKSRKIRSHDLLFIPFLLLTY